MTSLIDIRTFIENYIEDDSIGIVFDNYINWAVRFAEGILNWSQLKDTKTITVAADGILNLPPLYQKITQVLPSTATGVAAFEFHSMSTEDIQAMGYMLQYTYRPYKATQEADGSFTCAITQGSQTVTQVSGESFFVDADVGDLLMVQGDSYPYEILSYTEATLDTVTVYPPMASATASPSTILHNPLGMARLILKTPANVAYAGDVDVHYQIKHPELYDDNSMLVIPCPIFVALKAIEFALETNKYNVDADRLRQDLAQAKSLEFANDPFSTTRKPRIDPLFKSQR